MDMDPARFATLKSLIQAIVATTALVTAITSLVKACDKRLEQASYETLAASIHEVQVDQATLREELSHRDKDGDGIPDAEESGTLTCKTPSGAADAGVCIAGKDASAPLASSSASTRRPVALRPTPTASASSMPRPTPFSDLLTPGSDFSAPSPLASGRPSTKALPKWSDIKVKADSM